MKKNNTLFFSFFLNCPLNRQIRKILLRRSLNRGFERVGPTTTRSTVEYIRFRDSHVGVFPKDIQSTYRSKTNIALLHAESTMSNLIRISVFGLKRYFPPTTVALSSSSHIYYFFEHFFPSFTTATITPCNNKYRQNLGGGGRWRA